MSQEIIDTYTRSLYNILKIDEINIWEGITFTLDSADATIIKDLFEQTYMYYEIGVETISKFLDRLKFKVDSLCLKYKPLFDVYNVDYTADDIYANNQGSGQSEQKYYDTPQSQLYVSGVEDYLTTDTKVDTSETKLVGLTKAEAREIYADKLRQLHTEFVRDMKGLFMEIM